MKRYISFLTALGLCLALLGCGTRAAAADEAAIARVLNREALADVYIVNQVDALPDPERAVRLCDLIQKPAAACSLMAWGR